MSIETTIPSQEIREGDEIRGGRGIWRIVESDAAPAPALNLDDSPMVVVYIAEAPVRFREGAKVTVRR